MTEIFFVKKSGFFTHFYAEFRFNDPVELKLRLHTAHIPDFGMVKDADNIYYCTKKQVRRLCVGGDKVILP